MDRIRRRSDERARGITDAELRRYCSDKEYVRLFDGWYTTGADLADLDAVGRHLLLAEAVLRSARAPDAVLSHVSAALVHGVNVWNVPLRQVHVTRNRRNGARSSRTRVVHGSPYESDEVTVVNGLRVTTLARTIADLTCALPFEEAVCAGDDAARRLGLVRTDLLEVLQRRPTRSDHATALRAARFIDARSESVGESRSRVALAKLGYTPDLQRQITCGGRTYRVDFLLEEEGVIGEFDGRAKYGRLVADGDTPAAVVWREKLREDDLRDAGYGMARWTWADLSDPRVIGARIQRQCTLRLRGTHP